MGALAESGMHRVGSRRRHIDEGRDHRRARAIEDRQRCGHSAQCHRVGLGWCQFRIVRLRVIGTLMDSDYGTLFCSGLSRLVNPMCSQRGEALPDPLTGRFLPGRAHWHYAGQDGRICCEKYTWILGTGTRYITHPHHVRLPGQDIDLYRLLRVARLVIRTRQFQRHGATC